MPTPERRPSLSKAPVKDHPLAPVEAAPTPPPAPVQTAQGQAKADPQPRPGARPWSDGSDRSSGPRPKPSDGGEGPLATLSARVPIELRDQVKVYAAQHRLSVQEFVTAAVEAYLDK